jgi:hypothetical protein
MSAQTSPRLDDPEVTQQDFTPASTLDELVKAAFFVAEGIDAPEVDAVSPNHLNLHYPADGSLVSVRIEARPGAWGGIGPKLNDPLEIASANAHYDQMKADAAPPAPPEGREESDPFRDR